MKVLLPSVLVASLVGVMLIPNWKKSFEEVLAQIDSNVKQLEHIPTQILDKAFSGKLTIPTIN